MSQFLETFSSLKYKNFRIFWFGQIISSIGTWMQIVGQAWLVLKLTNSPFLLGLVVAFQYLPILFFSLYAGDIADRIKKRYIVIATQSSMALLSLILAILTSLDIVTYIEVLILTTLMGFAQTFDVPARQSFMIDLVGKQDLSNAIALNSTIFNLARIVGPAIAGIMIAKIGIKATFFANAISFVPLVVGLFFINVDGKSLRQRSSLKDSVKELLSYIKTNKVLLDIIILLTILSIFAMNFSVLVPLLAKYTLKQNAIGFGMLMTYMGLGSFFGAIFIAYISKKASYLKLMIINAFGLNIFQILMAISKNYTQASISIFAAGFSLIAYIILSNTTMQLLSTNELRGRIMSIYSLVFLGVTPFGSIFSGLIANYIGVRLAIFSGALIGFFVCLFYLKRFLIYATKEVNL
ncbi:MFS transporter [Desulfurella sp.]|uniref:MFS transporter n=1 Tax=Desulfurella sp. TaxID=1962857 RepID=UPI003D13469E